MKVYHFHNGSGGGVLSVIRNLLAYRQHDNIENHVIYTINKEQQANFDIPRLPGAVSEQIFYYSPRSNFYSTCRKLASLIPDVHTVLVAHDWLELGMISNLGLQNPVVQVLHGDFPYYYDLAAKHADSIDEFICVSPVIRSVLSERLVRMTDHISYLRFPVPAVMPRKHEPPVFTAIYVARDLAEDRKQFHRIPLIHAALMNKGIHIKWIIAGGGFTTEEFGKRWGHPMHDVQFCGPLQNDEILKLLPAASVILLPSLSEGFPVIIAEAMKCGTVPLITDWGGAVNELVIPGETGYLFEKEEVEGYVRTISSLIEDPAKLASISKRAAETADLLFDPAKNTLAYENIFLRAAKQAKVKVRTKAYGSRLDKPWLPDFITRMCR